MLPVRWHHRSVYHRYVGAFGPVLRRRRARNSDRAELIKRENELVTMGSRPTVLNRRRRGGHAGGSGGRPPGQHASKRTWRAGECLRAQLSRASCSAAGELVGADGEEAVFGADGGELGQVAFDFLPDAAERDTEDTLPARQEVDDLVG
jgi:hypothetical protein